MVERREVQFAGEHIAVFRFPPLRTTLGVPDPEDATSTLLELDALWSFVLKKRSVDTHTIQIRSHVQSNHIKKPYITFC